jgi:hypothetical protein
VKDLDSVVDVVVDDRVEAEAVAALLTEISENSLAAMDLVTVEDSEVPQLQHMAEDLVDHPLQLLMAADSPTVETAVAAVVMEVVDTETHQAAAVANLGGKLSLDNVFWSFFDLIQIIDLEQRRQRVSTGHFASVDTTFPLLTHNFAFYKLFLRFFLFATFHISGGDAFTTKAGRCVCNGRLQNSMR